MKSLKIDELRTGNKVIIFDGDTYQEDFVISGTKNNKNLALWVIFKNFGSMFSIEDYKVYEDTPKFRTKLLIQNIQVRKTRR